MTNKFDDDDDDDVKDDDYDVGFKKPPKETQFQKGQSGNPSGRPKGKRNSATIWNEVKNRLVTITENGVQREVTKHEAMFIQIWNKSASGDLLAMRLAMQWTPSLEQQLAHGEVSAFSSENDKQVLAEVFRRFVSDDVEIIELDTPINTDPAK